MKMEKRLNIAFYWHMHQPIYKDPFTGEYTMPWVLYHVTKDYYDMAAILDEFPQIHQTFNLVPSLIKQLNDYASGKADDKYINLTSKPASELTMEDKSFILQNFFQANTDNMIKPLPRYAELLRKRGHSNTEGDVRAALRFFTEQDYLDLQVLFNLVWIDPSHVTADPALKSLVSKGGGYTEQDKIGLLRKQIEIIKAIIPKYKDLMERGIIEVTTTPFYHPIMPLLCDSACALEAMPSAVLPSERFMHPEDARAQLKKGIEFYQETFGRAPYGIWPSEGSVSMDVLQIIKEAGIRWIATDEEILTHSVKREIYRDAAGNSQSAFLYKPYSINIEGARISMVFRDRVLSDLIGFEYAKSDAEWAASDMVRRLENIHAALENPQDHVVSIILDGENAWETFKNDGRDFLAALYSKLSSNGKLRCVTINEFLSETNFREPLQWVYPGSWINHNFKIWIGHAEDNAAWDYIKEARAALVKYEATIADSPDPVNEAVKEAWEVLYAAEGSDWFWWYGDDHSSMSDEHFDMLFRKHIKKIYSLIGKEPPDSLDIPIISGAKAFKPSHPPTAYIAPTVDGEVSNYFEWLSSGRIEHTYHGSSMHREHQIQGVVSGISYGFSKDALFMRLDYPKGSSPFEQEWSFTINFLHPREVRVRSDIKGKNSSAVSFLKDAATGEWDKTDIKAVTASGTVVEFSIPLSDLGCKPMGELPLQGDNPPSGELPSLDELRFFITITSAEKGVERWPLKGFIALDVPPEDFELHNWTV